MKTTFPVILVSVFMLLSACAPKVNDPADVQAIKQSMDAYVKAVNAKDAGAIVALMTDKTGWYDSHLPAVVGKDAIGKLHQALFDQGNFELTLPVADVRVIGNVGIARGTWTQKFTPRLEAAASVSDSGSWTFVFQRQNDGTWKWDWVVANSDRPMPGTTADGADEKALIQIEQDWAKAWAKADVTTLERILAKEWASNLDGQITSRAQELGDLRGGAYQVESFTLHDLSVHVFGDAAVVTSTVVIKGKHKGKDISGSQRSADFFVKRDGRWQPVSTQNVTIKP